MNDQPQPQAFGTRNLGSSGFQSRALYRAFVGFRQSYGIRRNLPGTDPAYFPACCEAEAVAGGEYELRDAFGPQPRLDEREGRVGSAVRAAVRRGARPPSGAGATRGLPAEPGARSSSASRPGTTAPATSRGAAT